WPRHTGDFALFRVYADEDGNPAPYSEDNVPLEPKQHLNISLNGHKEGDVAMILGYPGRTNRWMPSAGISQNAEFAYPAWVEGSRVAMDVLKSYMDEDREIQLDYASKYAGIANYWKNRNGMIDALKEHKTVETKRKTEKKFNRWANKKKRRDEYGDVIKNINKYYESSNEEARQQNYLIGMLRSSEFAVAPYRIGSAFQNYAEANEAKRKEMRPQIEALINSVFEGTNLPLEQEVLAAQLDLYYAKA